MVYTKHEVMEYVESEDVKFIRLAFCDVFGNQKNISIMPGELSRAFDTGIPFDSSAIPGFGDEKDSDLLLFPDPTTLAVLPWRPTHGRVVRLFCDIRKPDGTPFELDGRNLLRNAISAAKAENISLNFSSEYEFYLFKTDETGAPTSETLDNAGYMDIAPDDKGENVRREICLTLEEMRIIPESSHHECGPGQHEIDFRYASPLIAADNAVTFKSVVRTVAARNGLYASFDPKPIADKPGNGMHINISLASVNRTLDTNYFMAGVMAHIRELSVFLNPTENSYARLGLDKAPRYVSFGQKNRSTMIRIPSASDNEKRFELRSPDPAANPYIAYAMLIYAGLDGIKRKIALPAPTELNLFNAPDAKLKKYKALPNDLGEAASLAAGSRFVKSLIPRALLKAYMTSESN